LVIRSGSAFLARRLMAESARLPENRLEIAIKKLLNRRENRPSWRSSGA